MAVKMEYGQAGYTLQRTVWRKVVIWAGPLLLVAVAMLVAPFIRMPGGLKFGLALLAIVSFPLVNVWERRASSATDRYVTGRDGEMEVGALLREALGDDSYLLHDLDLGRGNVDHVVVAPSGIYTVETKNDLGKAETRDDVLYVNGFDRTANLKQAFAEAMQVHDYLGAVSSGRSHYVTPLIVFPRANVHAYGKCRGVYVLDLPGLTRFVKYERKRLNALQRSAIANALKTKVTKRD